METGKFQVAGVARNHQGHVLGAWCRLIVVESPREAEAEAARTLTLNARSHRADKEIAICSARLSRGRRRIIFGGFIHLVMI